MKVWHFDWYSVLVGVNYDLPCQLDNVLFEIVQKVFLKIYSQRLGKMQKKFTLFLTVELHLKVIR